jgi:hypothetical protein
MKIQLSRLLKIIVSGFIIAESVLLAFFMRPIQDDYFNLESVQQMGVVGFLADTWNWHGGNMVQFLIHCIVILPTTQEFVYWNFGLFFVASQIFVFFSVRSILSWLFLSRLPLIHFWVPLLSVVGFEGIFVPGLLGAYGFSLATLAHLWPVMAFTVGLLGLRKFRGSWFIAFLLGLIAGNSNLGESAFACGAWALMYLAFIKIQSFGERSGIHRNINFYFLGVGSILGTLGIAAAPGFWNRASDQVGLPHSILDFTKRFAKSFASFTADALCHPMLWVLLLLGAVVAIKTPIIKELLDDFKLRLLTYGTFLIWTSLIMGSTFAYPAWHQSMGMYVLLLPLAFGLGVANRFAVRWEVIRSGFIIASLITVVVLIRAGAMGVNRSLVWDNSLKKNICALKVNPDAALLGAEIQYPPFGLGVDDVNTWDWMRDKYVGWVDALPNDIKCD